MGNIITSNSNNIQNQTDRKKPRIFEEKENREPRSLISDAESEIVPI